MVLQTGLLPVQGSVRLGVDTLVGAEFIFGVFMRYSILLVLVLAACGREVAQPKGTVPTNQVAVPSQTATATPQPTGTPTDPGPTVGNPNSDGHAVTPPTQTPPCVYQCSPN